MSTTAIIWPVVAQVGVTAAVGLIMFRRRVAEMRRRRIPPQAVATRKQAAERLEDSAASDNFRNLFEVPMLFFVACLVLATQDLVSVAQLTLAWLFVGFRAAHSIIHLGYNRVMHRFYAYVLSTLCVLAMWLLLAIDLWQRG